MKWYLVFLLILCSAFVYGIDYTAPTKNEVTFVFDQDTDYTAPQKNAVTFIFDPTPLNITAPVIVDACGTTTIFHNQNLSCTFNATLDETSTGGNWTVNDSRVSIISQNSSGTVVDDPSLSDYNLPGCWDIRVVVTDNIGSDGETFTYCINNTAPSFNETIGNLTFINTQKVSIIANFSDVEGDNASISVNCTILNSTVNNVSKTYNLSREVDLLIDEQVCLLTISDTVLSNTQVFEVNISKDSLLIPSFNVTIGANLSALFPDGNFTGSIINASFRLLTRENMSTKNVTSSNSYLQLNNSDPDLQPLDVYCRSNQTVSDLKISVSPQFNAENKTELNLTNRLIVSNVSSGGIIDIFPFWDYLQFNYSTIRRFEFNITCEMEVP